MEVIDAAEYEKQLEDPIPEDDTYTGFRKKQDIPVHTGLFVEDLADLKTDSWELTGQRGAFVNLYGMQYVDDLQLHELTPGGETRWIQHYYDELVYVLEGNGITSIGEGTATFEWQAGSVFYLPNNAEYKHMNASGNDRVLLVSHTYLPQYMNLIKDRRALFDNDFNPFSDADAKEYYAEEGTEGRFYMYDGKYENAPMSWEANFIPDVEAFDKIGNWEKTGAMGIVMLPFPQSGIYAHISELPVGRYKNAHRHDPGANLFAVKGEGYDLLWEPGGPKIKIDWSPGAVFSPPANWYHQHFNTSDKPARQFVMHQPRFGSLSNHGFIFDGHANRNLIHYHQEDSGIRDLYEQELAEVGLKSKMPEECYIDPDYEFGL